jgi:tetratricopeptide (TPR) repeat protein
MASICYELGALSETVKELEQAISYYNEAIEYNTVHKKSLVSLAKLLAHKSDFAAAQMVCSKMIRSDVGTDEASMLMADISFLSNSYNDSKNHFELLLKENTQNYVALVRFLDIMKRHGKLEDAAPFFTDKEDMHAGYHYAKGLYLK